MTQDSNKVCEAIQQQEQASAEQTSLQQEPPTQPQEQTQTSQPQYAVRPQHHHRRLGYSDRGAHFRLRNTLNIAFMILAIVGVVVWTHIETEETGHTLAAILLLTGVVLKIAEVCIRLFNK